MPTQQELRARRKAKARQRRLRSLICWAAVLAAVIAVIVLVNKRGANLLLSSDDTDGTTPTSTAVTTTTTVPDTTDTTVGGGNAASTTVTSTTTATKAPTTTARPTTKPTTAPTTANRVDTTGHYVQKSVPSWELRLVNPWNPLPADFNYTANLADYASNKQFDTRAMNALRQMIAAGSDYNLSAASLYRSYDLQVSLFNRQVNAMKAQGYSGAAAEAKAATVVARPGTSEHHMGLAADILGSGYYSLEQSFENTAAFKWLKAHCAEYGFILRYPKEKEHITGVIYEPWHYRYVGVDVAKEIMSRNITLEEYLEEKGL